MSADKPQRLRLGLVMDPEFYVLEKSVCAVTNPLIQALCRKFQTRLIPDQATYDRVGPEMDFFVSLEAGWAAPKLSWRKTGFRRWAQNKPAYIFASDPHQQDFRQAYIADEGIDFVLAYYWHPTLMHFQKTPREKLIHFPWAIPENWVTNEPLRSRGQREVMIFGASQHEAYELRNWCRQQPGIKSYQNSGCDNKVLTNEEVPDWLRTFDAVVAAGSDSPKYGLVTPKYFETLAVGSLLFAQETPDTPLIGLQDGVNCVGFTRETFNTRVAEYLGDLENPRWSEIRERGRELIRQRHLVGHRIQALEDHATRQIATHKK